MEYQNYNYNDPNVIVQEEGSVAKKYFANVFLWMFIALGISTLTVFYVTSNPEVTVLFGSRETGTTTLGYIAMFAPLGLILLMGAGMSRLPYGALVGAFLLFAVLMGLSLSYLVGYYTGASVISCFAAAAVIFGIMAFLGYTTSVDLSKFGPILMVGVIGLFVAGIANMFIQSEQFSFFMAFVGIAVFTALTAYDVQKIKRIGMGIEEAGGSVYQVEAKKMAIIGAMSLYLDFINIFIYLLRIFGDRK